MIRNFVLAAALAAGGLAALPAPASAGDLTIGVDVSPVGYYGDRHRGERYYGGGYRPAYDRGYRHRWREGRRHYGYGYGFYRPRPHYSYRPAPRCRIVTVRSWNGYDYVTRTRETCGRRSYRY